MEEVQAVARSERDDPTISPLYYTSKFKLRCVFFLPNFFQGSVCKFESFEIDANPVGLNLKVDGGFVKP